jgi:PAS domain S-box-containing protein
MAVIALVPAVLGAASLATWWIGGSQMALGPDGVPTGPVTSVLLVAAGLALAALMRWPESRRTRAGSLGTSAATFSIGALAALQWWFGFPLPWDTWLLDPDKVDGAMPVGRMSLLTAISFMLVGLPGLPQLTRARDRTGFRWAAMASSAFGLAIGLEVAASYAAGTPRYYAGRTTRMAVLTAAAFVALSFVSLFRASGELLRGELSPGTSDEHRRFRRREVLAVAFMVVLVALAGLFYLRKEQTAALASVHQQLDVIANLKTQQIATWRAERLAEANLLRRSTAVALDVAALIARPGDQAARVEVTDSLEHIRGGRRYESVALYDAAARPLLVLTRSRDAPPVAAPDGLDEALKSEEVVVVDIHGDAHNATLRINILVPIRLNPKAPAPIAVIALQVDPYESLFPLLQNWPVPSGTAETLLVRRDGDDVVYLNEVRHQTSTPLTLRRPVNDPNLPSALALRGDTRVREGLDYRGTAVLATGRPIPGSPWVLIAKIDQAEAYGAIRREAWQTAALVCALMAALVLAGGFVFWQRRSESLSRNLLAEQERTLLSERLALVSRHANDIILLCKPDGSIIEANHRALEAYGYTLDELRALPNGGLRAPDAEAHFAAQFELIATPEGAVFETLHRAKTGELLPVEVSGRTVEVAGNSYLLFVGRHIAQRKVHEAEIERLNRLYAAHSQVNHAIVHAGTRQSLLDEVCRALVQFGRFRMAWVGGFDSTTGKIEPVAHFGDTDGYLRNIRITTNEASEGRGPAETALREDRAVVCDDFLDDPNTRAWHEAARQAGFLASMSLPVRVHGAATMVLSVYAGEASVFGPREMALIEEAALDIGYGLASLDHEERRVRAEEDLREKGRVLAESQKIAHLGSWAIELPGFEITWSDEAYRICGQTPGGLVLSRDSFRALIHPDDVAVLNEWFLACEAGDNPADLEFRVRLPGGNTRVLSGRGVLVRDEKHRPARLAGTIQDVTERKLLDETLRASLREKEALLREVHHRVKNNMQVISSLLRLETGRAVEPGTKLVLRDMQSRIRAMAALHETLYRTGNFARVDLGNYLRQLATQLFRMQNTEASRVHLVLDLAVAPVEIDQAIPCGLMVNELLTNCLKYAFVDGRDGEVRLRLAPDPNGRIVLAVCDTGVGLPGDFTTRREGSLGLQLVSSLVKQIAGVLEIGAGPGASFTVTFTPHGPMGDERRAA